MNIKHLNARGETPFSNNSEKSTSHDTRSNALLRSIAET